jgi:TonB family protein
VSGLLNRMSGAAAALVVIAVAARAQGTVCDSPCVMMRLPLIAPRDRPVPNSNPLAELQSKMGMPYQGPAYREHEVDKPAMQAPGSVWPVYPDSLKKAKVEGEVVASFAVDTLGRVDVETIQILKWTQQPFVVAVLDALPRMKFLPAELKGVKVRQLVQQPFVFHVKK